MKKVLMLLLLSFTVLISAQKKFVKKKTIVKKSLSPKTNPDLIKINDSIPALIPQKLDGKFGFINQKGKVVIKHEYSNVGFFTEDCMLLNSPNEKVRKFGSKDYASARLYDVDFRIDQSGKRVYKFKNEDLGNHGNHRKPR